VRKRLRDLRKRLRDDARLHMRVAATFATSCFIGWPVSLVVTNEPPLILSLSWLALILPALVAWLTAKVEDDNQD
jgi:hypothetical protein